MPELPEVESVRRGLAEFLTGARITAAEVLDERILGTTSQRDIPAGAGAVLAAELVGDRIESVERRGKYMWSPLESGRALSLHLGMSGQTRIHAPGAPRHRHTRAVLGLAGEVGDSAPIVRELHFVDQRIFGHIGVEPLVPSTNPGDLSGRLVGASAAGAAPDPFEKAFNVDVTVSRLKRKNMAIKSAILDQTVISGIGNIYADEALHRAGVHPLAVAARLRSGRVRAVVEAAREVMAEALEVGGTSFDALYVNVNGESGYFARDLNVYGRSGLPCKRCGTPIVRKKFTIRSSHFCPSCQRKR